jgi:hypothetical protein
VSVDAYSGTNVLTSWGISVTYNTAVLSYVSGSVSAPLFNTPSVNSATAGTVSVAATGIKGSTPNSAVTGKVAAMLTLTFTVVASAPAGLAAGVMSGTVASLVNQGTITFLTNGVLSFADSRVGWQASGQLMVLTPAIVGVYAHMSAYASELVNTAPLTGSSVIAGLTVMGVYGTPRASPGDAFLALATGACTSTDADVTTATTAALGCTVTLATSHSRGAARTNVSATYGGYTATVSLRVWYPSSVQVLTTQVVIYRVTLCSWQTAVLRATAVFGGTGLAPVANADVTPLVTFVSSSPSVATVSGQLVTALAAGAFNVSAGGCQEP